MTYLLRLSEEGSLAPSHSPQEKEDLEQEDFHSSAMRKPLDLQVSP